MSLRVGNWLPGGGSDAVLAFLERLRGPDVRSVLDVPSGGVPVRRRVEALGYRVVEVDLTPRKKMRGVVADACAPAQSVPRRAGRQKALAFPASRGLCPNTKRAAMRVRTPFAVMFGALSVLIIALPTSAQATRCGSAKLKATANYAVCRLVLEAREAAGEPKDPARVQRCGDHMLEAFSKIEAKYSDCFATGHVFAARNVVDVFIDNVDAELSVGIPNKCQAAKLKASGKKVKCMLDALAREAATARPVDPASVQRCHEKLTASFTKAEATQSCATNGDAGVIEDDVDRFVDDIYETVVAVDPPPPTTTTTSSTTTTTT